MEAVEEPEEDIRFLVPWAHSLLWKFVNDKLYEDEVQEWLDQYEAFYGKNAT